MKNSKFHLQKPLQLQMLFPFVDGIEKLIQSGVKAVIQPSGSIADKEIIKFANETNTVLIFQKLDISNIKNLINFSC